MRVRINPWLPAAAAALMSVGVAGEAAAQCGSGCTPPPPPCCAPPPPPPPPPACCQPPSPPGGNNNANSNVNVNVNIVNGGDSFANSDASASARGTGFGRAGVNARLNSYNYGGGGGGSAYTTVEQPYPTTINGLNVEGGWRQVAIQTPFQAWRRIEKRVVIRALCIDDRNVPHPASQVRPGRDIGLDYDGELYRCLAGTRLQYTWAEYVENVNFDHGETIMCAKGEALWYGRRRFGGHPGGPDGPPREDYEGPGLECRPQKPERDCNERSLLRRYGAGIKVLVMVREEMYTEMREEFIEESASVVSNASMVLDGGVGGRVF